MGESSVQELRTCSKCGVEKELDQYYIHNKTTNNPRGECKECTKAKRRKHTREFPFRRKLDVINQRCYNPNNKSYKYYGMKGVKCFLSVESLRSLWDRDKGYLLKYPSIDRIDSTMDYTIDNCKWIEQYDNVAKNKTKQKSFYKDIRFLK